MKNDDIYIIQHSCWIQHQNDDEDGEVYIFGREPYKNGFCTIVTVGNRSIRLIQRVRDHWVVDTWLSCKAGISKTQTKLMTHNYLKQITRNAKLWSEK